MITTNSVRVLDSGYICLFILFFFRRMVFLSVLSNVSKECSFSLIGCFNYPVICSFALNLIIQLWNGCFSPLFSALGTLFADDIFLYISVLYTNIVVKIDFVIFHVSYYDKFSVAYDLHLFQSAMDVISNSISDPILLCLGRL